MKLALLFVCLCFAAIVFAEEDGVHHGYSRFGRPKMPKSRTLFEMITKPGSNGTLNNAERLASALNRNDLMTLMRMVDSQSVLIHPSHMPFGGLYKGKRGALEFAESCSKTFETKNTSCHVKDVREDKGIAIISCSTSGRFVNSNKQLSDSRSVLIVRFRLDHISFMKIVELNPRKVSEAYHTDAEYSWLKLTYSIALHGLSSESMAMVSDDLIVKIYGGANVSEFSGKESLVELSNELGNIVNNTAKCNVLISNNSTVVDMCVWGDPRHLSKMMHHVKTMPAGYLPMVDAPFFFISRKNFTGGKLSTAEYLPGRLLTPQEIYRMRKSLGTPSVLLKAMTPVSD